MVPWQSVLQGFNMHVSPNCPRLLCIRKSLSSHCSVTSFTRMFSCGCTVLLLLTALIPLHKVASLFPSFYPLYSCLSAADLLACMLCQTQEEKSICLSFYLAFKSHSYPDPFPCLLYPFMPHLVYIFHIYQRNREKSHQ